MAISSVSITPPASSSVTSVTSNAAAPFVNDTNKPNADNKQASTVVTLSAQARQLNQNEAANQANQSQNSQQASNNPNNQAAENVESRPKEKAEVPGIQFIEGESKGGRVNVVA